MCADDSSAPIKGEEKASVAIESETINYSGATAAICLGATAKSCARKRDPLFLLTVMIKLI